MNLAIFAENSFKIRNLHKNYTGTYTFNKSYCIFPHQVFGTSFKGVIAFLYYKA